MHRMIEQTSVDLPHTDRDTNPPVSSYLVHLSSFLGLSRLGNGADLTHQAKLVLAVPRFGDLAFLYAVDGYACEFHLLASRRDAHILTLVGGLAPPASNDHVVPSSRMNKGSLSSSRLACCW
jgi:hypothetical protein